MEYNTTVGDFTKVYESLSDRSKLFFTKKIYEGYDPYDVVFNMKGTLLYFTDQTNYGKLIFYGNTIVDDILNKYKKRINKTDRRKNKEDIFDNTKIILDTLNIKYNTINYSDEFKLLIEKLSEKGQMIQFENISFTDNKNISSDNGNVIKGKMIIDKLNKTVRVELISYLDNILVGGRINGGINEFFVDMSVIKKDKENKEENRIRKSQKIAERLAREEAERLAKESRRR